MQMVFTGEHVQVTFDRHQSDVLVVTFSDHFHKEGGFRKGFGELPLRDANLTTIHVKSSFNHWWQTTEIFEAINLVKAVSVGYGAPSLVTYGASMGGYAAIHFANFLKASRAVAFSPQSDLWNDREIRWRAEAYRWPRILPEMRDVLSSDIEYLIVVDPREKLDMMQALGVEGAKILPLENYGHRSVPLLAEIGHLKPMMLSLVSGTSYEEILSDMRMALRTNKRNSSTYLAHFLTRLMRSRKHHFSRRILALIRSGNYLSIEGIKERDFIAFMRAAAEARDELMVDKLFTHSRGETIGEPYRASYLQTLERNGFVKYVDLMKNPESV